MEKRRREILGAVESLRFKSGIDADAVQKAAHSLASGLEFYLDSAPHRVEPMVVTDRNAKASDDQKMEHRIYFKVRFKRKQGWEPGFRKSALVLPSTKDALSSVLASVSGVDVRLCELVASSVATPALEERRAATAADVRRLVRGYSESHHGSQVMSDLLKWAREKAQREIADDLQRVMATAVANGFTEEQVVTIMRTAVVKDVMRK